MAVPLMAVPLMAVPLMAVPLMAGTAPASSPPPLMAVDPGLDRHRWVSIRGLTAIGGLAGWRSWGWER
jgi:hypothetical protein